jgi:hypothetical protein
MGQLQKLKRTCENARIARAADASARYHRTLIETAPEAVHEPKRQHVVRGRR